MKKEKISKVIMNKNGKGNLSPKLGLPVKWLEVLGVTEESPNIKLKIEEGKIIIEKEV